MTTTNIVILTALFGMSLSMVTGCQSSVDGQSTKPAIVLVAFGTSKPEARKVFDYIDARTKERYPDYDVQWAFTSEFIRKKLMMQGIETHSVSDVVAKLKVNHCNAAVFQSLHIVPGQEFSEIQKANIKGIKVAVGKALLTTDEDISFVIQAVTGDIAPDSANVFASHGNNHHPEFNVQLVAFAKAIESQYDNVFVCSVEGQLGTSNLKVAKEMSDKTGNVNFIPLMLVAGDHISNDVLGDGANSWKSIIAAQQTTCAKPLGYNDAVLAVYFRHIDEAMASLNK